MLIDCRRKKLPVTAVLAHLMMAAAMAAPEVASDFATFPIPLPLPLEGGDFGFYFPTISSPMAANAVFILGDSSVDCGENTLLFSFLHRNLSLFPCNGSNSDLIPNLLAAKMGLSTIPSFYSLNGSIRSLVSGVNFGSAQATILYDSPNPSFQSLNQQLRQVFETIQLLSLNLGPAVAVQHIQSSIFYLSFGKEDFIRFFLHEYNSTLPSGLRHQSRGFLRILADQMVRSIRYLYDVDVRKIVVMGVLPVGCAPRSVVRWYSITGKRNDARGCVDWINRLVVEYNSVIEKNVLDLNLELPDAHIVYCDVYEGIMELIAKPRVYGFGDSRNGCCGKGWHHAVRGCTSMDMACDKPSSFVWWDMYNPTVAVNSLLAESAWSGKPFAQMCHPMTVQELMYA